MAIPSYPKIVVIGAEGLLGSEILRFLSQGPYNVKGVTHKELDITRGMDVAIWLQRLSPDYIINCAALSDVDYCEEHSEEAFQVNAEGVKNLCAPLLEDIPATLIHFSTDYVFDGKKGKPYMEGDPVNPLNHYAESKLQGEEYVGRLLPDRSIILRVQWLYGPRGNNFSTKLVREITQGGFSSYSLLTDRIGSPTPVTELAKAVDVLIHTEKRSKLYHLSSSEFCSWFEFGKTLFDLNGISNSLSFIHSVKNKDLNRPAMRPFNTTFSCDLFKKETGFNIASWKECLGGVLQEIKNEIALDKKKVSLHPNSAFQGLP